LFKRNLDELTRDVNRAIERGVATDETARDADGIVQDARKAIRVINEIRLQYTRPIDEGKKNLMREVERLLKPLSDSNKILDSLCMERTEEIRRKQEEARIQAEEQQRAAEEERQKEIVRREKLRLAADERGCEVGTDTIESRVPEVEVPVQPVEQIGMRVTTRTRSIPDIKAIEQAVDEGIREIAGVSIFQAWKFTVVDAKIVPEEYRRTIRG